MSLNIRSKGPGTSFSVATALGHVKLYLPIEAERREVTNRHF